MTSQFSHTYHILQLQYQVIHQRVIVIYKSTCLEIHPRGGVTSKPYKPAFHGGHLSHNTSYSGAAILQIFHLPWQRYSYSTQSSITELLRSKRNKKWMRIGKSRIGLIAAQGSSTWLSVCAESWGSLSIFPKVSQRQLPEYQQLLKHPSP